MPGLASALTRTRHLHSEIRCTSPAVKAQGSHLQEERGLWPRPAVRAEPPERSPFLEWARQRQLPTPVSGLGRLDSGVVTSTMHAQRQFVDSLGDRPATTGAAVSVGTVGAGEAAAAAAVMVNRCRPVTCPYASPEHLIWRSDLHTSSKRVQEQVNQGLAHAERLRAAEAVFRPLCRVAL